MKCLSVHQPWAWLIERGVKRVENRSWWTSYRGPLAIHASQTRERMSDATERLIRERWPDSAGIFPGFRTREIVYGAVLCTVVLVDCVKAGPSTPAPAGQEPWCDRVPGTFWWVLERVTRLDTPLFVRGMQGLFEVDLGAPVGRGPGAAGGLFVGGGEA